MKTSLRHLRVLLAVHDSGAISRAAGMVHVSQPAVTQAVAKLERLVGHQLFLRRRQGLFPTPIGSALTRRVRRALAHLDPVLAQIAPRLVLTATAAQLQGLIATCEAENFTLAARRIGRAQPTLHRAVSQLEHEAGQKLFERTAHGLVPRRPAAALARAARLAFAELDQAESEMAELAGREAGRIVIGAMPLSRSVLLPQAIARFRALRPTFPVRALDGPYADLVTGLRRGEIDVLVGALRDPAPVADVVQEPLFDDNLVIVARPGHPILALPAPGLAALAAFPCVVAPEGTPARLAFDRIMAGVGQPASLIETGSMVLLRELLLLTDHLGCISRLQIGAEIRLGALVPVPVALPGTLRPIGLTQRADWVPTRVQADFLAVLRAVAAETGR